MRILIATSYGFNARMRNFIEFTVARLLANNGWHVTAFAESERKGDDFYTTDQIKVFKISNIFKNFFALVKKFLFEKPNVVHVFNMRNNHTGIVVCILCKIFRVPCVFTEYGLLHDHYLVTDRDNPYPLEKKLIKNGPIFNFFKIFRNFKIKINFRNYAFHFVLNHANEIVFISKHNLEIAKLLGFKNLRYLPHIFDESRWAEGDEITEKNEKVETVKNLKGHSYNLILFIGQIKLRKGWDIILEAMRLLDKNLNAKLIFITATSDLEPPELKEKIDGLGVRDNVIFLGKVDGPPLKEIYELAKVVVVPSRYEGFGLAVTEAWEMKKPVIASDVPAINEHLVNKTNGLSVLPEDPASLAQAIEITLKDPALRQKITEGGLNTLGKLKSAESQNQWLDFYKNILKK